MGINDSDPMAPKKPPRTRVVIIVDEETGELDYFVMRSEAEIIVLEQPEVALGVLNEMRRVH